MAHYHIIDRSHKFYCTDRMSCNWFIDQNFVNAISLQDIINRFPYEVELVSTNQTSSGDGTFLTTWTVRKSHNKITEVPPPKFIYQETKPILF